LRAQNEKFRDVITFSILRFIEVIYSIGLIRAMETQFLMWIRNEKNIM